MHIGIQLLQIVVIGIYYENLLAVRWEVLKMNYTWRMSSFKEKLPGSWGDMFTDVGTFLLIYHRIFIILFSFYCICYYYYSNVCRVVIITQKDKASDFEINIKTQYLNNCHLIFKILIVFWRFVIFIIFRQMATKLLYQTWCSVLNMFSTVNIKLLCHRHLRERQLEETYSSEFNQMAKRVMSRLKQLGATDWSLTGENR